jgi:hypothetical protein
VPKFQSTIRTLEFVAVSALLPLDLTLEERDVTAWDVASNEFMNW